MHLNYFVLNVLKNNYIKLFFLIAVSFIVDNLFIQNISNPPAWDQGYHLSNVFKMYNILDSRNLDLLSKFNSILNITDNYRGPITYFISALFLKVSNNTYQFAYLSNQLFNIICIFCIFNLGKIIKNEASGVWASIIFTFSNLILNQRADYLIDLSLTSFSCLSLLFLTKWYLDNKAKRKYSIFSGLSLGLVFLCKPTGIVLFIFPLIIILWKTYKSKNRFSSKVSEILLFLFAFLFIIFPWFSKHWLTIITSTINAWNWGINYQEGLDSNNLESWAFYFKKLPTIFGVINFYIFAILFLLEKIFQKKNIALTIKKMDLWFFIYFLNCYLVVSLMSTKDMRFILPLYPLFCIYLSLFINTQKTHLFKVKNKKIILIISISISLFLSDNNLISTIKKNNSKYEWPNEEIIKTIKDKDLNLTSTLAVLPDLKELNTFNLEAEAARQGEFVSIRQVVSNKDTYRNDLKYFDWFLVKTGYQGIMTNEAKILLNKYLLANESFITTKNWELPDNSQLYLLRRKSISSKLIKRDCTFDNPTLKIKQINNGININLMGSGKLIKNSNLLLDFIGNDFENHFNVSLANGFLHQDFNQKNCYLLSQNISLEFPMSTEKNLIIKAKILNKDGSLDSLKIINNNLIINDELINNGQIQMANRISEVESLGTYLKNGQFENLFNLVGIINQSDPRQEYLKDSEKVYLQRYKENKNLKNLYSLLISQILQRKVIEAKTTIDLITDIDTNNGNAQLVRALINIFLFDGKNSRISIERGKVLEKSSESEEILKTLEGLTYLLEMKFINAYKVLA